MVDLVRLSKLIISLNRGKRKYYRKGSDNLSKMYTCEEIAEMYGVKIFTVWDWIKRKKIKALKIGREYRIREEDLKIFEESASTIKEGVS